jgi:hypothetical protein
LRERSVNTLITPWAPSEPHISEVMAHKDREVVIHLCKKFRSRIEAIVEASGNFIKYINV